MPHTTFSTSMLNSAMPGLSKLAASIGGGDMAYMQGQELQSKIAQAMAAAQAAQAAARHTDAQTVGVTRQNELQTPEELRKQAMMASGVPLEAAPQVDSFIQSGRIGAYNLAPTEPGPVMPPPDWASKGNLSALAQRIANSQSVVGGSAKSAEDAAKSQQTMYETNLAKAMVDGTANPQVVGQAQAAVRGSPLFHANEFGSTNAFTGAVDASNPVAQRFGQFRQSGTQENLAQAGAARAAAGASTAHAGLLRAETEAVPFKTDPLGTLGFNKAVPAAKASAALAGGDEYLATLPPGVAAQVKAMADGKLAITPQTLRTPQGQALLQMAMQYEPGTDQTTYISRAATARDAASGKLANSNNALNTVAGHLQGLSESADALNNTRFPWWNTFKNAVASNSGEPQVKTFNLNLQGVVSELERAYRGAGGSEGDINKWRATLGDSNSPQQFKEVLAKGAEMLQSKLEANHEQYVQGMRGRPGEHQTITPKARAALDKLRGVSAPAVAGPDASGWTVTQVK